MSSLWLWRHGGDNGNGDDGDLCCSSDMTLTWSGSVSQSSSLSCKFGLGLENKRILMDENKNDLNLCSLENADESLSHENRCKLFKIKVHKCNICIKENLPLRIFQQAFCCLILKQSLYEDCLVIVVELRYQCGSQAPLKYCQLCVFVTDLCGIWFGVLAFRSWFSHNSRWRSLLLIALELRYQ